MLSFNYVPDTTFEQQEFQKLHPEQWQIDAIRYNPEFTGGWGPGFDNAIRENQQFESWEEFTTGWKLDQYNYCVNFYFEIDPYLATTSKSKLCVVFWFIQPRKGYNATVTVKNITEREMSNILQFLRNAQEHNATLFKNLPGQRRTKRQKRTVNAEDACIAIGRMTF